MTRINENEIYPIRQVWARYDRPLIWLTWKDGEEENRRLVITGDILGEPPLKYLLCDLDIVAIKQWITDNPDQKYPELHDFFLSFLKTPKLLHIKYGGMKGKLKERHVYVHIVEHFHSMTDPVVLEQFVPDRGGREVDMSVDLIKIIGPEDDSREMFE